MELFSLRIALRSLRRTPAHSLSVVTLLAVGIAGVTAVFGALYALVLRPLPYPQPERLVALFETHRGAPQRTSLETLHDWERGTHVFASTAGYRGRSWALDVGDGELPVVYSGMVTPRFFETLGVHPRLGRAQEAGDGAAGAPRVAWLAHEAWQARFGGDPSVVGRTLRLNDVPHTIVGVLPQGFTFLVDGWRPEVWIPLEGYEGSRSVRALEAVGRLRTGVSVAQAQAQLGALAERLAVEHPETNAGHGVLLVDLRETLGAQPRETLLMLLGAAALLLAIACVSLVNLALARATARLGDTAIRIGLGASRADILRQHLREGALLGAMGGAAGCALALLLLQLPRSFPALLPSRHAALLLEDVRATPEMMACAVALVLLLVAVTAVAPTLLLRRLRLHALLRGVGAGAPPSGGRLRAALVVAQVALTSVMLVCGALLLRSFVEISTRDPGLRTDQVVTFGLGLPEARYSTEDAQLTFHRQLLEALAAQPGFERVGGSYGLPFTGAAPTTRVQAEREPLPLTEQLPAAVSIITPGYLEVLQVPLRAGRALSWDDGPGREPTCLVSEGLARRLFGAAPALGQRLSPRWRGTRLGAGTWYRVVGVVGDVRQRSLDADPLPHLYLSMAQLPVETLQVVVRTRLDAAALTHAARSAVRAIDPRLEQVAPKALADNVAATLAERRALLWVLGLLGTVALLLATAGLTGVLVLEVTQRQRELGIRLALGASPARLVRRVVQRALGLAALGLALAALGSLWAVELLQGQLVGVGAADPLAHVTVSLLVLGLAAVAALLPALRAARVDPASVLRGE